MRRVRVWAFLKGMEEEKSKRKRLEMLRMNRGQKGSVRMQRMKKRMSGLE